MGGLVRLDVRCTPTTTCQGMDKIEEGGGGGGGGRGNGEDKELDGEGEEERRCRKQRGEELKVATY